MATPNAVGVELLDLADRLDGLTEGEWNSASLCDAWRVRDVVAHVVAGAEGAFTVRAVAAGMLRYRFDYDRWVAADGVARGEREPSVLVRALRTAAETGRDATKKPPPVRALAHVVIHGQDICRPLGITRELPEAHLAPVAEFVASSIVFRAKKRIAGLRLVASDIDWSRGDGPEVAGAAEALVMTMAGRPVALDERSGEGAEAIRRTFDT